MEVQTTSVITQRKRSCISIQNQFSELIYQDTDDDIVPWYSDWSEESSVSSPRVGWVGWVGGWSLKWFAVDKISIKLQLPIYEGKSRLIFPFYQLHNPSVDRTEILELILQADIYKE